MNREQYPSSSGLIYVGRPQTAVHRRINAHNASNRGSAQKNLDLVSAKVLNLEVQGVKQQLPKKAQPANDEDKLVATPNFVNQNRRLQSAHISKKSSIAAQNLTSVLK